MRQIIMIIVTVLILSGCYTPSVAYKEVSENDKYENTEIIRQRENGIMGTMNECNACWFYFDIIYDKVGDSYYMYISYSGDDWLFIERAIFLVDGETIILPFSGDLDLGYGDVYEWATVKITKDNLKKLVYGNNVSCRLSGKYYYELSNSDLKTIRSNWKKFADGMISQYINN